MKKRLAAWLLAGLCVLLAGCGWVQDSYTAVKEHREPYVYTEPPQEDTIPTAADADALKNRILSFVRNGVSNGQIDVTDYSGDVRKQIVTVLQQLKTNPIYAYAVDYADYEITHQERDGKDIAAIRMVFRRSAQEIAAIQNIRGMLAVQARVTEAVEALDTALTLKISEYSEMDFALLVRRFCLENPTLTAVLPELSVQVYPDEGETRVLELHLSYPDTREELRSRRDSLDTTLNSAARVVQSQTQQETLQQLCSYLLQRDSYSEATTQESPVYQLLTSKQAGDAGFASAAYYILKQCGMDCRLVLGERDGAPYCWNLVCLDGRYFHLDLMQQWRDGSVEPRLVYDSGMTGYAWDAELYPSCTEPEQTEPNTEPTAQTESTEPSP